jgi:hypothetical protein
LLLLLGESCSFQALLSLPPTLDVFFFILF